VTEPLVVHVNRGDHRDLEPAVAHHETSGPFVVRFENHGEGSHVHLSLGGDLGAVGTVEDPNPFLAPETPLEVSVEVDRAHRPLSGTVELSTGYGQESVTVDVELTRNTRNTQTTTRVPERAGGGSRTSGDDGWTAGRDLDLPAIDLGDAVPTVTTGTVALLAVAGLAVLAAVVAWQLLEGAVVTAGVIGVLATVVVAVALVVLTGGE